MEMRTKLLGIMMVTALLSAPLVFANDDMSGDSSDHHGEMHKRMGDRWMHKLKLTDDQKKQLKANEEKQEEAMKGVFKQMKSSRESLEEQLLKPAVDLAKIAEIQTQMKVLGAQMADIHLNSILEVKKILTSEQFAKFLKEKEHRFEEMSEHQHHKHGKKDADHKDSKETKD